MSEIMSRGKKLLKNFAMEFLSKRNQKKGQWKRILQEKNQRNRWKRILGAKKIVKDVGREF